MKRATHLLHGHFLAMNSSMARMVFGCFMFALVFKPAVNNEGSPDCLKLLLPFAAVSCFLKLAKC